MILFPGCFCCSNCKTDTDFTRPPSLPLTITVVSNAASGSNFGAFSGIKSSYTLDQYSYNPAYHFYNAAPGTSISFNDVQIQSFLTISPYQKYAFLSFTHPVRGLFSMRVECYAEVLSASGDIAQGTSKGDPTSISVTIQGVAFNPTFTLLSAASPVLPIRVFGTLGYQRFTTDPWTSIPVDFTITGWLPFKEMT